MSPNNTQRTSCLGTVSSHTIIQTQDYSDLEYCLTSPPCLFRKTAQKPGDELYASFKEAFPQLGPLAPSDPASNAASNPRSMSLGDVTSETAINTSQARYTVPLYFSVLQAFSRRGRASVPLHVDLGKAWSRHCLMEIKTLTGHLHHRPLPDHEQDAFTRDMDQTPKGNPESWRLTPSLLDPNSYAFASFANQPPGYYTPNSGGTNTLYHNQAGVLHTPSLGAGTMTPLSLPTSEGGVQVGTSLNLHGFPPGAMQNHPFSHFDPFAPQGSFAPSQFQNQPNTLDVMDASADASPLADDSAMDHDHPNPSLAGAPALNIDANIAAPLTLPTNEQFRYHVTLNAPTAMIKRADEIPVTYLNKGQAYSISIVDTLPPTSGLGPITYRTFIRVSFEDEQQRERPASCWQLWKEGRGSNEAHQRGGKLQAVECVEPTAPSESDGRLPKIDLERASFDGFSVIWTAAADGPRECTVAVRFNFLSTDFSHSKGVKGIPVRLCAKTQLVPSTVEVIAPPPAAELCYCKVKLFRDHGAERKLSNDVAHVKKTIEKLQQQIAQVESGLGDPGKKKRSPVSSARSGLATGKPGKVHKHKRTWSMSSNDSGGVRSSAEDDLHQKLATMQDMFTSTRSSSVLYLRGLEHDDPDLHPVYLTGEPLDLIAPDSTNEMWSRRTSVAAASTSDRSSLISPVSSHSAGNSQGSKASGQQPLPPGGQTQWTQFSPMVQADLQSNPQHLASPPDQTVKVPKNASDASGQLTGFIDAIGVDGSYRPPPIDPSTRPGESFIPAQVSSDALG